MKRILLLISFTILGFSSMAQLKVKVGAVGVRPAADMEDYYVGGVGAEATVKYVFAGRLGVGISSGFQHFFTKDWGKDYIDAGFNVTPLKGSIVLYMGNGRFKPYIGAEAGLNFTKLKYTYKYYYGFGGYTVYLNRDYGHTRFGASPMLGFDLQLSSLLSLDFNLKYNYVSEVKDSPMQNTSYLSGCFGLAFWFGRTK